jgi:AraC-like DNA-binding protein
MPIQMAAFRVGYHDVSSFTRAFRRHFGFTPGQI